MSDQSKKRPLPHEENKPASKRSKLPVVSQTSASHHRPDGTPLQVNTTGHGGTINTAGGDCDSTSRSTKLTAPPTMSVKSEPAKAGNKTGTWGNASKRKRRRPPKKCPTQSEYDDTGWCDPSDFAKIGGKETDLTSQQYFTQERGSPPIDPQKECEEAVLLLTEFSQRAHGQVDTISTEDLASLSCGAGTSGQSGGRLYEGDCVQFESPSSLSSPALVISTTPPKKAGKKRKLQASPKTTGSQSIPKRVLKTPEKQRSKKLLIATRQLVPKTPPKPGFKSKKGGGFLKRTPTKTEAGTCNTEESPRKSARIASLDHRISWKKGKKRIKKVKKKKKKKKSMSSESESDGWEEESESSNTLEFDSDLEARLEENAAKNNLTAINVKSILHHVITNEHVLAMVRNTMQDLEEPENSSGSPEKAPAVYEPKLTRSKLKEVTEKVGGSAVAWPLTPVKNAKPVPQFDEIDFPEDSDEDEDYRPSHEDLTMTGNESDYESVASSQRSDFGSPCPSTPRSHNVSFNVEDEEDERTSPTRTPSAKVPSKSHISAVAIPMGPPMSRPRVDRVRDDMSFLKQLDCYDAELKSIQETIAHRTRSKHAIHQPVEEIEASFMPPDIAHDMYDSDHEDKDDEWVAWLAGLSRPRGPESVEPPDDEQNDPEYNFLAEEETVDTEDFRNDKAVRVSKKELDELMDELMDAYGNEVDLQQAAQTIVDIRSNQPMTLGSLIAQQRQASSQATTVNAPIPPSEGAAETSTGGVVMSDGECQQLQQQMQQHVQLLCQMSVMSRACGSMQKEASQAKKFLTELNYLADNFEQAVFGANASTSVQPLPYNSFFRTSNLQEACSIADNPLPQREPTSAASLQRHLTIPLSAIEVMASSTVFMYPELLPAVKQNSSSKKLIYTDSEDNLIVCGLDQFKKFDTLEVKMKLIQEHMMPAKTVKQLCLHVKNASSKRGGENVIKAYRKHGIINPLPIPCEPVAPGGGILPTQLYENRKPEWLKKYMQVVNLQTKEEQLEEGQPQTTNKFQPLKVPEVGHNISTLSDHQNDDKKPHVGDNIIVHKMTRPAKKVVPQNTTPQKLVNIQPKILPGQLLLNASTPDSTVQSVIVTESTLGMDEAMKTEPIQQQVLANMSPNLITTTVMPAVVPAAVGASPCGTIVPSTLSNSIPAAQQPIYIAITTQPHGFQNRLPVCTQGTIMSTTQPTQMLTAAPNVYSTPSATSVFQQPAVIMTAAPQQMTAATANVTAISPGVAKTSLPMATNSPGIQIPGQSTVPNASAISPGSLIKVVKNTASLSQSHRPPVPIQPIGSPVQQSKLDKLSQDLKNMSKKPLPKKKNVALKLLRKPTPEEQAEIDKANKLLEDIRKRLSSSESENEMRPKSAKKKNTPKPKPQATQAEQEAANQLLQVIRNKLASQSSSEAESEPATNSKTGKELSNKAKSRKGLSTQSKLGKDPVTQSKPRKKPTGTQAKARKDLVTQSKPRKDSVDHSKSGRESIAQSKPIQDSTAQSKPGKDSAAQAKPGKDSAAQSKPGKDSAAQAKPGKDSAAQSKPGKDSAAQSKTGKGKQATQSKKRAVEESPLKMAVCSKENDNSMDTESYFPSITPSPEDAQTGKEEIGGERLKRNEQNQNESMERIGPSLQDVLSSPSGVPSQLTRRTLFQKTKSDTMSDDTPVEQSADTSDMAPSHPLPPNGIPPVMLQPEMKQSNTQTTPRLPKPIDVSCQNTTLMQQVQRIDQEIPTENQAITADQQDSSETIAASQATQLGCLPIQSDNQVHSPQVSIQSNLCSPSSIQGKNDQPPSASETPHLLKDNTSTQEFDSPPARTCVQIQPSHTPSPPIHVQSPCVPSVPTSMQSPMPNQPQHSLSVSTNPRITFHSPPVSSFRSQVFIEDSNSLSPPGSKLPGKSPKGISALRNFKLNKSAVARQSPVSSPLAGSQIKSKTARQLIEVDHSPVNTDQNSRESTEHTTSQVTTDQLGIEKLPSGSPSDNEPSVLPVQKVLAYEGVDPLIKSISSSPDTSTLASVAQLSQDDKPTLNSPSDALVCKEPVLSDDELKPLSKEEEEFYEEPMDDEEEVNVVDIEDEDVEMRDGDDGVVRDADSHFAPESEKPNLSDHAVSNSPPEGTVNKDLQQQTSPTASEKSTYSNTFTPPSSKPGSNEPSPSFTKSATAATEDQDGEDVLTSPELKSKHEREGGVRPSVTFEDSNSMDTFHSGVNTRDGEEEMDDDALDMENADSNLGVPDEEGTKKKRRIPAKRIKTKLRRVMESTVVLLDPNIVSKDPERDVRDQSFSKTYLTRVKEELKNEPIRYVEFLRLLSDYAEEKNPDIVKLYQNMCTILDNHCELVEEFTAFLPQGVALQCGVLIPNLEFAKARLFLRQMEVHFRKQPTHFQKILSLIIEWGGKEDRTNQELKDLILPELKGQPHLQQEFSLLFPNDLPPESHMMDFEYITLGEEEDSTHYDDFEEIEVSDCEDEIRSTTAITTKTKPAKKKRSSSRKTGKGQLIDPWKGWNAELQYGTHSCKCNCHDKSLDLRVKRKVRHCAYCSAGVSRLELISSLKGLRPTTRRPISDDDNGNSIDGPEGILKSTLARGSGRSAGARRHRGRRKTVDWDLKGGGKEGGFKRKRMYSEAVSHLSQMCDSLADYLSANANTSDEDEEYLEKYTEDEKETDDEKETEYEKESEDEKETEDEDHDDEREEDDLIDEDDDVADDEIDIAETDEDDIDIALTEDEEDEDDEEEDEDIDVEEDEKEDKPEAVTSGESRDAVVNSPYASSHGSHSDNDDSEDDASNPASPSSPLSESELAGVKVDGNRQMETKQSTTMRSKQDDGNALEMEVSVSESQTKSTQELVEKDDSSERVENEARAKLCTVKEVEWNKERPIFDDGSSSSGKIEKRTEISLKPKSIKIKNRTGENENNVEQLVSQHSGTKKDTRDDMVKDTSNVNIVKDAYKGDLVKDVLEDDPVKDTTNDVIEKDTLKCETVKDTPKGGLVNDAPPKGDIVEDTNKCDIAKHQTDSKETLQVDDAQSIHVHGFTSEITEASNSSNVSLQNNPNRTLDKEKAMDNNSKRTAVKSDEPGKEEAGSEMKDEAEEEEEDNRTGGNDDEDMEVGDEDDVEDDIEDDDDAMSLERPDSRDGDVEDEEDDDDDDLSGDDEGRPRGDNKTSLGTPVIWTREADRILLQSCQERDPTDSLFAEIAEKLQDKTAEQVSLRFSMLMQLFNSSQEDDDDDDDDDDEDEDDEEEDEDEENDSYEENDDDN